MIKYCEVCHEELVGWDGYFSCPIYLAGKTKEADEHTSFLIEDGEDVENTGIWRNGRSGISGINKHNS